MASLPENPEALFAASQLARELADLMDHERDLLASREFTPWTEIQSQKRALLERLEAARDGIESTMERHETGAALPPRTHSAASELSGVLVACRSRNESNARLLARLSHHTSLALRLLSGDRPGAPEIYRGDGSRHNVSASRYATRA